MGFRRNEHVLDGLYSGDVLIIADDRLDGVDPKELEAASAVIVIGTTLPAAAANASVVLPITNFAEEEGTFTNLRGRVQRFTQAKAAPGLARPSWLVLGDLLGALGLQNSFYLPSEVFAQLAKDNADFAGLNYESLGFKGLPVLSSQAVGAA